MAPSGCSHCPIAAPSRPASVRRGGWVGNFLIAWHAGGVESARMKGELAMFRRIMVPVDLAHIEHLEKALTAATDLAQHYKIPISYIGITAGPPTEVAHSPKEYADKLEAFGQERANASGLTIETVSYVSHDPAIDLDKTLLRAAHEQKADLIVMASHVPNFADHFIGSHGGKVATHADISVFLVR